MQALFVSTKCHGPAAGSAIEVAREKIDNPRSMPDGNATHTYNACDARQNHERRPRVFG